MQTPLWRTVASLAAALVASSGCASPAAAPAGGTAAGGQSPTQPKAGGIIKLDLPADPQNLNPMFKEVNQQEIVLGGTYLPLLRLEMNEQAGYTGSKILPFVADKWEMSADATQVTFHLRNDVKWQNKAPVNGRPFTAEDVKYNLLRFRDEKVSMARFIVEDLQDVATPDAQTVQVKMKKPFTPLVTYMAWDKALFHPKELVDANLLDTEAIGTGPFMLDSFQRGSVWHMKKNPDFFMKDANGTALPYIDGYDVLIIKDPSTAIAAFVAGQLDLCGRCLPNGGPLVETIRKSAPKATLVKAANPGGTEIYVNNAKAPFTDARVRRALVKGLDVAGMVQVLGKGEGLFNAAGVGIAYKEWTLPEAEFPKLYPHDIAGAQALLKEAGYDAKTPISIYTDNSSTDNVTYTELLQSQLKAIGFNAVVAPVDYADIIDRRRRGDFVLYTSGKSQEIEPDGNLYPVYHTGGSLNYSSISDPKLDQMLEQQRGLTNVTERQKLIQDIVRYIASEGLSLNPVTGQRYMYWQNYVNGFYPHLFWGYGIKLMQTWMAK